MQAGMALGGALIGYAIPGVGPAIGMFLGNVAYQAFLAPAVEGPRIKDPGMTDSAAGAIIPKIYGTVAIDRPVIIDCSQLIHNPTTAGGFLSKGGGGVEQDRVFKTYAILWGRPPIGAGVDLLRLKIAQDLKIDLRAGSTGVTVGGIRYKHYRGDESQNPDPWLEELHGAGNVQAHRGYSYTMLYRVETTKFGGATPPIWAELASAAVKSYPWDSLPFPAGTSLRTHSWAGDFDRWAIYSIDGASGSEKTLVKRDAVSGAVIAYLTDPTSAFAPAFSETMDEGGLKVDLDGRVYGGTRGFTYRFDPNGLQALVEFAGGSLGSTAQFQLTGVFCHHSLTYGPFITRFRADGNWYMWDGVSGALIAAKAEGTDYSGDFPNCGVSDADGYLWLAGGDTLRKWSIAGVTGAVTAELTTYSLAAALTNAGMICYDPVTNRLHIFQAAAGGTGRWAEFDIDTAAITDSLTTGLNIESTNSAISGWLRDSIVVYAGGTQRYGFDVTTKTETKYASVDYGYPTGNTGDETLWNPLDQSLWCDFSATGTASFRIFLPRLTPGAVTLRSILEDQAAEQGLAAADYNFTAQTQLVQGFPFYGQSFVDAALQLRPGYQFDVVLRDWIVTGVNRGGASGAVIPEEDLGASENREEFADAIEIADTPDDALPRMVRWYFPDKDRDYEENNVEAWRAGAAVSGQGLEEVHFQAVMTVDEARNAVHRYLYEKYAGRFSYKAMALPTGPTLRADPADIVTLTRGGINHLVRLTPRATLGANWLVGLEGRSEDPAVYGITVNGVGAPGGGFVSPDFDFAPPSEIAVIDGPLLWAADDGTLGNYVVVAARSSAGIWEGARIKKSTDGGATFDEVATITAQLPFGFAVSVLGFTGLTPGNPTTMNAWDDANTLDVSIINGLAPANKTDQQIYDFAEIIAVGHPARGWEIIQAGTKTLLSGNVYRYGHLLRGRFGSEQWADDHQVGDYVVHLEKANMENVRSVPVAAAELNVAALWKAESLGDTFPTADALSAKNIGTRLKPLAGYTPVRTDDSPGAGDVTVGWSTRSRMMGAIFNAPTGETSEVYRVDIYTTGDVFKRTVLSTDSPSGTYVDASVVNAPKLKYKSADRTTDGLTGAAQFKLHIYQISPTLTALKPAGSTLDLGYPLIVTV